MANANKFRVYFLTENGKEESLFFSTLKAANEEMKMLHSVDNFNNYESLSLSVYNNDYEDYLQKESKYFINRM